MTITSLSFCIQSLWKSCTREFHIKNNTNCWKWLIWSSLNKFLPLFLFLFFLQVSRKITRFFLKTTLHPCKKRKRKEKEKEKKNHTVHQQREHHTGAQKGPLFIYLFLFFSELCCFLNQTGSLAISISSSANFENRSTGDRAWCRVIPMRTSSLLGYPFCSILAKRFSFYRSFDSLAYGNGFNASSSM